MCEVLGRKNSNPSPQRNLTTSLLPEQEHYTNRTSINEMTCIIRMLCMSPPPPRDCSILTLVVGLVFSNESWSYAGGSVATGRASHARLVRDEDPD